jgi:hypothetical protein
MVKITDLCCGTDVRGDHATFIEEKHFSSEWDLDAETKKKFAGCSPTFFRVIKNGIQQSGHGWIEDGEIIQWG